MTCFPMSWYTTAMTRERRSLTPKALSDAVSSGKFEPLYYFYGTEDYRIVEAEKFVAHQFLPERQIPTNYRRMDGRRTKCVDILAELSAYPMLGERQVIAVSDIQSYNASEIDRILKILDPPDPNRIVVFSSPSARTPRKNSAAKNRLASAAVTVEFTKMTARETAGMISRKLAGHGLEIEPDALTLLTELVGGNRGAVETETGKLVDYVGQGRTVTAEDIRAVSAGFQVYSIFTLADEIINGDRRRVLRQVQTLIADGSSPTGILFFVGQHFLSLYLVRNDKPLPPNVRFLAGKFRQQASRFDNRQLEYFLTEIAACDAMMRRQSMKPRMALEALVLKLMESAG